MDEQQPKEQPPPKSEPEEQLEQPAQLNSLTSFRSADQLNQDLKEPEDKPKEEDQQQLRVVQSKVDKGINHEQIMRMFQQQLQKEEREREQIEKRRLEMRQKTKENTKSNYKRPLVEEKKTNKGQALQQALSEKSARIRKIIQPLCKKYRSMFRPSIYDTKMNKYRFECKEKLFLYLCFGIEQLKQFTTLQLSEAEREALAQDSYYVVKKLATQIDAAMIKLLNKGDKNEIGREYKSQWETLLNNIKDETNLELKRKILARTFQPIKIAIANEIDFFTLAKREEILEKQKRYVAEFTVEKAIEKQPEEPAEEPNQKTKMEEDGPQGEPQMKPHRSSLANKYIEESSIIHIEELLSEGQLQKMLKRLEEDIQGKAQTFLIRNFKQTFRL